jgi:Ca2+-binding RTX toxin-like protein
MGIMPGPWPAPVTIQGGAGDGLFHGEDGNDYLSGGPGSDRLFGDAGNDQLFSLDNQRDTLDGGEGFDRQRADQDDLHVSLEGLVS